MLCLFHSYLFLRTERVWAFLQISAKDGHVWQVSGQGCAGYNALPIHTTGNCNYRELSWQGLRDSNPRPSVLESAPSL